MNPPRTFIGLGLSVLLLAGSSWNLTAQDQPEAPAKPAQPPQVTPAPSRKPIRQQLTGRVVAVEKRERTLTLQVDNLTYVLQIADSTRISRKGGERVLSDVIVGEEISVNVVLRELANGRVEVAVLSVELSGTVAAQGKGKGARDGASVESPTAPPPFQNSANSGNQDGPIISPNR